MFFDLLGADSAESTRVVSRVGPESVKSRGRQADQVSLSRRILSGYDWVFEPCMGALKCHVV